MCFCSLKILKPVQPIVQCPKSVIFYVTARSCQLMLVDMCQENSLLMSTQWSWKRVGRFKFSLSASQLKDYNTAMFYFIEKYCFVHQRTLSTYAGNLHSVTVKVILRNVSLCSVQGQCFSHILGLLAPESPGEPIRNAYSQS